LQQVTQRARGDTNAGVGSIVVDDPKMPPDLVTPVSLIARIGISSREFLGDQRHALRGVRRRAGANLPERVGCIGGHRQHIAEFDHVEDVRHSAQAPRRSS
jgi:hypothetical protein